jgi:hypothetical protein
VKDKGLVRRFLLLVVFTSVAVTAVVPITPASALAKPRCPDDGNKALVVDVTLSVKNVDDTGLDGHVWALDDLAERLRIWQTGTNRYCVRKDDEGAFTSFAGVSPAGSGTISAGVTGSIEGATQYFVAEGRFAPTVPTSGYIGAFDPQCHQDGTCANDAHHFPNLYFSRVNSFAFGWYSALYNGGGHGTWSVGTDGTAGDITG